MSSIISCGKHSHKGWSNIIILFDEFAFLWSSVVFSLLATDAWLTDLSLHLFCFRTCHCSGCAKTKFNFVDFVRHVARSLCDNIMSGDLKLMTPRNIWMHSKNRSVTRDWRQCYNPRSGTFSGYLQMAREYPALALTSLLNPSSTLQSAWWIKAYPDCASTRVVWVRLKSGMTPRYFQNAACLLTEASKSVMVEFSAVCLFCALLANNYKWWCAWMLVSCNCVCWRFFETLCFYCEFAS